LFSIAEYPKHRRQVQNLHTTDLREKKNKKKTVRSIVSTGITIPILKENSVSIFGIKILAGAPQKIGGSPLFPKKGGPRPPLCTLHPPFEEKKEFPRNFSKKEFPRYLKKVFPPNFSVQQYRPKNTDTGCI
jgi:hypothetical protein